MASAGPVAYTIGSGATLNAGRFAGGQLLGSAALGGLGVSGGMGSSPSVLSGGAALGELGASGGGSGFVLPAWLSGKPLNIWFEIPNTNISTLVSANGITTGAGIFEDFNGTVLKADTSEVFAFGGGHGGTWVNTLAAIDYRADVPGWRIECEPTPFADIDPLLDAEGGSIDTADLWWGTVGDRRPNPPHTYSSGQYLLAQNRLAWFGRFGPYNFGGSAGSSVAAYDLSAHAWVQPESGDYLSSSPFGRMCCPDPATGLIYGCVGQTVVVMDPAAALGSQFTTVLDDNRLNWSSFGSVVLDKLRGRLVRIGNAYSDTQMWAIRVVAGTGDAVTDVLPLLNGDSGVIAALLVRIQQDTVGACVDPINDRIIVPGAAAGGAYYAIRLSDWLVTLENPGAVSGTVPGTPTGSAGNGLFNRIHYLPAFKTVVMNPRGNANSWAMRLEV